MINGMRRFLPRRWQPPADLTMQVEAYRAAFSGPHAQTHVLPDLAEYCGAVDAAPEIEGMFAQGRAAGRRDVWLHIQRRLCLTDAELYRLLKAELPIFRTHQETIVG